MPTTQFKSNIIISCHWPYNTSPMGPSIRPTRERIEIRLNIQFYLTPRKKTKCHFQIRFLLFHIFIFGDYMWYIFDSFFGRHPPGRTSNDIIAGNCRVLKAYMVSMWIYLFKKIYNFNIFFFISSDISCC